MGFTYNVANRKCITSNSCFYNTRTGPPDSHWYENSLQWRAHKVPSSQSRGIRLSSSEFIFPDPDYIDEAEDATGGESMDAFEVDETLELSIAHRHSQCFNSVAFILFCMVLTYSLWK